ncbi:MAG: peptidyl-dipeptidase Dcp [Bacteroidetes bacterium]|nr:peptidyl-dipeptidase Dcp [Bacteroidota bacterium]
MIASFAVSLITAFAFRNNVRQQNTGDHLPASNPFSSPSILPYHAAPFDKIKDEDYKPAFEEGIRIQQEEIRQIADNPAAPTFENTLVALEKAGQLLTRVNNTFNMVTGANTNPVLQKLQVEMAPKLASINDAIFLNSKLFKKVETIYLSRKSAHRDAESNRLIEYYYQQFLIAGGKLSETDKEQLKKFNQEEATFSAKFGNQLLAAASNGVLIFDDTAALSGSSQNDIENYAQYAKNKKLDGKYLVPLQNTTQQPPLKSLTNRDTRKQLFDASWTRAEKNDSNDTRSLIVHLATLRAQKAKLLGFPSYAAWKLQDQMAKNPENVFKFFAKLNPSVTAKVKKEIADIQSVIDQQKAGFSLEPWDWDFYAEQVRKAKYNLDDSEIKPYFEINSVLEKGVFYAANQLYGLSFKERHDIPVYQQDVRVFEVFDKDNKPFALFYCDYFKRDNKNGGAWMNNLVGQSTLLGTKPVIYNVCNFNKPAPGKPALITFTDVTTMFHEFGHALHGLFASQKYPTLSGTSTARDFVEFPSQFNEHWALDAKVLKNYAHHYKTGEIIPQSLVEKMKKANSFNKGYGLSEAIAASLLDMQWHTISADEVIQDEDAFEKKALDASGLDIQHVPPRYRSTYFLHIWSNGYSAGYYAYQWTKMLEQDAFAWFDQHGGLTRANGQRFRDMILSRGNTEDYNVMFKKFTGHDPDITAMQKGLGLMEK